MNSSIPDIASLQISQSNQQRINDSYDYDGDGDGNIRPHYHFSTSPAIPAQSALSQFNLTHTPLKNKTPARGGLPSQWLDDQTSLSESRSLSPPQASDLSSGGGSPPMGHLSSPMQAGVQGLSPEDEIIPTAIVIKNIPFNVKRETLLDIIASLNIPQPYAFNYHLDPQGQFRGLAFANFRQAVDADAVVAALNGFDVQGRKLRVEYKKVLQAGEKERIEREKAIRRMRSMQLEKEQQAAMQDDFGTVTPSLFTPPRSFSGSQPQLNPSFQPSGSPPLPQMPISSPYGVSPPPIPSVNPNLSTKPLSNNELDMNDAATLEIYSRILLFKDDPMRDELAFSRTLSPKQRRIVHLVAQKLGVYHYSIGEGEERYAVVTRIDPERQQQNTTPRYHTLSRAPSAYISPSTPLVPNSLRTKKSMPDMKTLHTQTPRLTTRSSNGNIREGYATIGSPMRRSPGGFGSIFSNNAFNNSNSSIPPVPSLPANLSSNGMLLDAPGSNVVRQPRGPSGGGGFGTRRERVSASESAARGDLDTITYEALEF